MEKEQLKVKIKDGCEKEFEEYCKEHDIYYRQYPIEALKTTYRIDCCKEDLNKAKMYIKSIETMPIVTMD